MAPKKCCIYGVFASDSKGRSELHKLALYYLKTYIFSPIKPLYFDYIRVTVSTVA